MRAPLIITALAFSGAAFIWPRGHEAAAVVVAPRAVQGQILGRDAQYVRAIEEYYLPAKHEAERTGNWFHTYEIARAINSSCTLRDTWDPVQLSVSIDEPAQLPGMEIDWKSKTITAARELASCIQVMRAEAR